jgi:ATP-binding cassette subfamily B protein
MIPIRQYVKLLARYLRSQRPRVVALTTVLFVGIGLQVVNPQIIKVFIDRALAGEQVDRLIPIALLFIVIAVVQQAMLVGATWIAEHVGWTATNELRRDLADHLLHLDMSFHKQRSPGEMVERIDGDVSALSKFFSQFSVHIVGNAALIIGVLALITRESWIIGLGMTLLTMATLGLMTAIQRVAVEWWRAVKGHRARFYGFIGEVTASTEDVQANGAGAFMARRSHMMMRDWLPDEIRGRHGWSIVWGASIANYAVGNALVFAAGSWLFGDGAISLGSVYLIFHYSDMMRHPLDRIRSQMEDMQKAGAGITRVQELLALRTRLPDDGETALPAGALSVDLEDVDFSYVDDGHGDGERVLHGMELHLGAGRVLGVLGRTGSGKTTMARLLTRLYDPESGVVRLGGVPAPQVHLAGLRRRVGMVTQDVQLFRASIRDNLTFFDASIDDATVMAALDELGLAEWVASKPAGLDTLLEAGGSGLSAGEGQLLAFTRIFLEDSGLLVLDEASSRVDPATEQLIEQALDRLLAGRTGVIIAHHLDTVQRADDIAILDGGRVVEFGVRTELAADPTSRFSGLLRTGIEEVLA